MSHKTLSRLLSHVGSVVCVALLAVACDVKRPSYVLSDKEMEEVLYDFHVAQIVGENLQESSREKRERLLESAFRKHHIGRADFDTSLFWYSKYPDKLEKIYTRLNTRIEAQCEALDQLALKRGGEAKARNLSGDTVNLWTGETIVRLSNAPMHRLMRFHLTPDTTYRPTDCFQWSMRMRYDSVQAEALPYVVLQVRYSLRDTLVTRVLQVDDLSAVQQVSIAEDTLRDIRDIYGYVYQPLNDGATLTIDRIALMRYHRKVEEATMPEAGLSPKPAETAKPQAAKSEEGRSRPMTTEELKATQKSHNPTPSLPQNERPKRQRRVVRRAAPQAQPH